MVFYIADSHRSSPWTRRCLRQADCVVVLALASQEDPSKLSPVEQAINAITTKVGFVVSISFDPVTYLYSCWHSPGAG